MEGGGEDWIPSMHSSLPFPFSVSKVNVNVKVEVNDKVNIKANVKANFD